MNLVKIYKSLIRLARDYEATEFWRGYITGLQQAILMVDPSESVSPSSSSETRRPNHWVRQQLDSTEHEVMSLIWTKEAFEDREDEPITDEQWKKIVHNFNCRDFQDLDDTVDFMVNDVRMLEDDSQTA